MGVRVCACVCVCVYVCVCMYVRTYTYTYPCMYVCMYNYIVYIIWLVSDKHCFSIQSLISSEKQGFTRETLFVT